MSSHVPETTELVADFIRRLEQAFRSAYGREPITTETGFALLQGQGLRYTIFTTPAVSWARSYQELCIAAKNEKRRQLALSQRRLYKNKQDNAPKKVHFGNTPSTRLIQRNQPSPTEQRLQSSGESRRRYICNSPDHLAKQYRAHKAESKGDVKQLTQQHKPAAARKVESNLSEDIPKQTIRMLDLA